MELDSVFKLLDAGFTADEIRAYDASPGQDEAAGQDATVGQDATAGQEQASMSADIIDALNAQFDRLTKAIQANNINTMSHGGQKSDDVNSIMEHIINGGR